MAFRYCLLLERCSRNLEPSKMDQCKMALITRYQKINSGCLFLKEKGLDSLNLKTHSGVDFL